MYKHGSIVLFRSDLEIGQNYDGIDFLPDMYEKQGTLWVIDEYDESDNTFTLIDDSKSYWYSTEMLIF